MKEQLSAEEFQEFVVDQLGKMATGLSDVRLELQTGFRELRVDVTEMKETLAPLARAFDNDAEKIVEHEQRIDRLERHLGISKHA